MPINADRNQRARQKLVAALRTNRAYALTGAGVSWWAGYKLWPGVLNSLAADVDERYPGEHNTDVILQNNGDPLLCAQKLGKILGDRFRDFIRREFGPRDKPPHDVLLRLIALPFRHFLTLNFDDSIENAHRIVGKNCPSVTCSEVREMSAFLLERETKPRQMVHLHGLYSDPIERIALAERGYDWLYSQTIFKKFFWSIFSSHTLVFMGLGFQDMDLNIAMRDAGRDLETTDLTHFALVGIEPDQNDQEVRNNFKGRFLIEPVFYPVVNNDHSEFVNLINGLLSDLNIAQPVTDDAGAAAQPIAPAPQPINADLEQLRRIQDAAIDQLDPEGEQA